MWWLLRVRYLLARLVVGSQLLCAGIQRWIEPQERGFDGSGSVVAGPASISMRHSSGRFAVGFEAVIGPLVRIAPRVFHLDGQAHQIGLVVPFLIDGTSARGIAFIDYEHGLFGPLSGVRKLVVGPALHEDVGEHLMAAGRGAVVHAISGGEEHPLAVVGRADKLTLVVVLRLWHSFVP